MCWRVQMPVFSFVVTVFAWIDLRYISTGNDMIIWEVTIFPEDNLHKNVLPVLIVICIVNVYEADQNGSFAWLEWVINLNSASASSSACSSKKNWSKLVLTQNNSKQADRSKHFDLAFWFLIMQKLKWIGKGKRIKPFPSLSSTWDFHFG